MTVADAEHRTRLVRRPSWKETPTGPPPFQGPTAMTRERFYGPPGVGPEPTDTSDAETAKGSTSEQNVIVRKLEAARRELLDLTTRNRLLSTPRHSPRAKTVEIVDEKASEIFRLLVAEAKKLSFLPKPSGAPDVTSAEEYHELEDVSSYSIDKSGAELELEGPEDELAERHTDSRLQTSLDADRLRKRLLQLHYDARSAMEEQGFNILYLALGFLKWFDDHKPNHARYAPLVLIPVELSRTSARTGFKVSYSEEELSANLSLKEKLRAQSDIQLPDFPDEGPMDVSEYFMAVDEAVRPYPEWEVLSDDIVLGVFSFSKFLMYQDLDPTNWPTHSPLESHELISRLLTDGFVSEPVYGDDADVDAVTDPADLFHVVDADSSQTLAIEEVRHGRSLIIQGPPGTGKSQTIANLIAAGVKDGNRVLFLAEKRAALEVVKRRLDHIDLGNMCLELHSHKARKKVVLEDLDQTLRLGRPRMAAERVADVLREQRDRLNLHAKVLHEPMGNTGISAFRAMGRLVQLKASGMPHVEFLLPKAIEWAPDDIERRRTMVADQARLIADMGQPDEHIWRGAGVPALLPSDIDRLVGRLDALSDRLARWNADVNEFVSTTGVSADTLHDVTRLCSATRVLGRAPELDRETIANTAWTSDKSRIDKVIAHGQHFASTRGQLQSVLAESAWHNDLGQIRQTLARHGDSIFRLFSGEYREAVRSLRSYTIAEVPSSSEARLALLDSLDGAKRAKAAVIASDDLGNATLGRLWQGLASDWKHLEAISEWVESCRTPTDDIDILRLAQRVDDRKAVAEVGERLLHDSSELMERVEAVVLELELSLKEAFSTTSIQGLDRHLLAKRIVAWTRSPESLHQWTTFRDRDAELRNNDLGALADALTTGKVQASRAIDSYDSAICESIMRKVWETEPSLRDFDGRHHDRVVDDFRRLDQKRSELARAEVAAVHHQGIPRGGGTAGQVGAIHQEIQKKRRHKPLRRLLQEAGTAVQRIKPVFMMSPMSVAQYLAPGSVEFDLLLIDEASQVRPVEALGAIARSRQMVVVGDKRQLPPTRFFDTLVDDGESEDDFQVTDVESVLTLCEAMGMLSKMLRWHYRSRHESLIAVSNRSFYQDRLFIVPSPIGGDRLGLSLRFIADGTYDRGGTATNPREAKAVADAVIEHARRHPSKSLGVGTFSVAQRDAILDELELQRRIHPEVESFFAEGGAEPFFVKNLETIQGDERDVVFLSVGYGKDESGFMAMNFGPLSNDGGERRLNVLISRAKERMEVFTSIVSDDIDVERTRSIGPRVLKRFLQYAKTGYMDVGESGEREPDSEFEEEVGSALVRIGYQVVHQVGTVGFLVDLAIVHPNQPGRYALGIECDGASYHSSRSARDRDRLRQAILEDRGWKIHRIWSTDWFKDPEGELRKVHEAAQAVFRVPSPSATPPTVVSEAPESEILSGGTGGIERASEELDDGYATVDYQEAAFPVPRHREPHLVGTERLAEVVKGVVEAEGPIHREELSRRIAHLWGLQRAGSRIQAAAAEAARVAKRSGEIVSSGGFLDSPERAVRVRDRTEVSSKTLLKAEMLPPSEIREALRQFIAAHVGCTRDEAVVGATRLFGFRRAGEDLKAVMEAEVRGMLTAGALVLLNGQIRLA